MSLHGISHDAWKPYTAEGSWYYEIHAPGFKYNMTDVAAGSERGRPLTGAADSRITPVGRVLRKWKIDELPQLVNVLRGEMALVGPRPEVPSIVAGYTEEQRQVLSVRPGVTGPSQIRWRNEEACYPPGVDTEAYYLAEILPRKLGSDLEYVRTRSLPRDLGYLLADVAGGAGAPGWAAGIGGGASAGGDGQAQLALARSAHVARLYNAAHVFPRHCPCSCYSCRSPLA